MTQSTQQVAASVVICTFNRADTLNDAISATASLHYSNFEIVIVAGPSTDSTPSILKTWQGRVKIVSCTEQNLAVARNLGIEAASGDIVAFIDDDAAPHPLWLSRLADAYTNPKLGAAGGFTLDGTGRQFQVRKTLCDRLGDAHKIPPFFDERSVCFPGSPLYPSLLGTNASFRRDALVEIGGFDHVYAYFLDETDVCLRLVDAGWLVDYVPSAIVQHRFAASELRDERRVPKTLYYSCRSKAYFAIKHGHILGLSQATAALEKYRNHILECNAGLLAGGMISDEHRFSLDQDLEYGLRDGVALGMERFSRNHGDLKPGSAPFRESSVSIKRDAGLRIALISQGYPPRDEAGISTYTKSLAEGLARRGHAVHVVTRVDDDPGVTFENGHWVHRLRPDRAGGASLAACNRLPLPICDWAVVVKGEVDRLKECGLDIVCHPIWDLEGAAIWNDPEIATVLSLHTTYALAKEFKPEWQARPLYEHFFVSKVIDAERRMIEGSSLIIANSQSIIKDVERIYGVAVREKAVLAQHGTRDLGGRDCNVERDVFHASYIGRFEIRKGFDVALQAVRLFLEKYPLARVTFAGGVLDDIAIDFVKQCGADCLLSDSRVQFAGLLTRSELDLLQRRSDVILIPSRYESFGLVAIEAMSAGVPVVALRSSGIAEIVEDGRSGFLVDPDQNAPINCSKHMIALARDAALRDRMGVEARAMYKERYTVEQMVSSVENAFRRALLRGEFGGAA